MRRRGRARITVAIMIAAVGVGALAYPGVSNLVYDAQVDAARASAPGLAADKSDALYQYMRGENERFFASGQAGLVDAFSYETPGVDLSVYGIADDRIGFIRLPSIHMTLPIYLGATRDHMRLGAVHLTQTSYPIGGQNTNAVIAAHRGGALKMFRHNHLIKIGDDVLIDNPWGTLHYRAAEIRIIKPTDINDIKIQKGRDLVTLISCNPLGHNYERYVVYCERVD
jgi:sortase A